MIRVCDVCWKRAAECTCESEPERPEDKLTELLQVRISPALLGQVNRAAAREGRRTASWVRGLLRSALAGTVPARPEGLIPGTGRMGEPKALRSTLSPPRTFICPHMSIGNVVNAECRQCGPLTVVA